MKKKIFLSAVFILLICALCADPASASKKVKLNRTKITMQKGKTVKLTLKNAKKKKIKWSTMNKRILSVSKSGKIKALRAGKTKVYAKYKSKKYVCTVRVTAKQEKQTTPAVQATSSPEPEQTELSVLENLYISDIVGNEYDWFVMIDYQDASKTQKFSNSYQSFQNADITLNGESVEIEELQKGDILEIGYLGELSEDTFATIPGIQYVKAVRD